MSAMISTSVTMLPMDCTSPPALDLCTRRRDGSSSPRPEGAHYMKSSPESKSSSSSSSMMAAAGEPCAHYFRTDSPDSECASYPAPAAARRPARPFKAYPKDPLFLALGGGGIVGGGPADAIIVGQESSAEAYAEFRSRMLSQVKASGPAPGVTNARMRRTSVPGGDDCDARDARDGRDGRDGRDASYWEKRRKNNEAAKRSRDARRAKEDEIAIRAAFLEQENLKLKYEIAALRTETSKLRCMLYN